MIRKALMPLIWILLAVIALAAFAFLMNTDWVQDHLFSPDEHHQH